MMLEHSRRETDAETQQEPEDLAYKRLVELRESARQGQVWAANPPHAVGFGGALHCVSARGDRARISEWSEAVSAGIADLCPRVALGFARAWQRIQCSFPPQWEIAAGAAQCAIAPGRRRVLATSPGHLLHDGPACGGPVVGDSGRFERAHLGRDLNSTADQDLSLQTR